LPCFPSSALLLPTARRYTPAERRRQGGQRDRPRSGHRSPLPLEGRHVLARRAVLRRAGECGRPVRPGPRRRL